MVRISNISEHWYDDGIDAHDWSSAAISLLWRLKHVRKHDCCGTLAKRLSTLPISSFYA
jgi:hypothetical protein